MDLLRLLVLFAGLWYVETTILPLLHLLPSKPVDCIGKPAISPPQPENCNGKPVNSPPQPANCIVKPVISLPLLGNCIGKPVISPPHPEIAIGKPVISPPQPDNCIGKPVISLPLPGNCIGKPVISPPQPDNCIGKPVISLPLVGNCIGKPVISPPQPEIIIGKPVISPPQPENCNGKPVISPPQPDIFIGKPVIGPPQPEIVIGKPVISPPQPENCIGKLVGCLVKPVISPPIINPKPCSAIKPGLPILPILPNPCPSKPQILPIIPVCPLPPIKLPIDPIKCTQRPTVPAPTKPSCTGPHEIYSECGNDACQKNCDTYDLNLLCKPICNPGCICEDGYIRNKNGRCILPEECENRQCGNNQIYTQCVCPCCDLCSNLGKEVTCNFLVCHPGCTCKPGFYRNSKNECVAPSQCDCPNNEVLNLCHTDDCKPACVCKPNYKRDSNGDCVLIEKCPKPCDGENEEWKDCGTACPRTCENLYSKFACTANCVAGCFCKDGFVRKNGKCVRPEECACGDYETLSDCAPNVQQTCATLNQLNCMDFKPGCGCKPGCVCIPGYVRDCHAGKCVPISSCNNQ